jgi:hypothetical protein
MTVLELKAQEHFQYFYPYYIIFFLLRNQLMDITQHSIMYVNDPKISCGSLRNTRALENDVSPKIRTVSTKGADHSGRAV